MENQGNEIHIDADEARGGSTNNVVRWVLGISVLLAIGILSVILITGAATQGERESAGTAVESRIDQDAVGDTDGVLINGGDDGQSIGSESENVDGVEIIEN